MRLCRAGSVTCFINICGVRSASVLLAPLFWFACIVAYLPYGFIFLSFFTLEFVQCRGDIVSREFCRMSIVLHSTSLFTRSEKWVWHCAYEPAFRRRVMYEMCDVIWWWRWLLPRTSQVARKERTRTVMCYCGRAPVPCMCLWSWSPPGA
jgi:hypothetical protein